VKLPLFPPCHSSPTPKSCVFRGIPRRSYYREAPHCVAACRFPRMEQRHLRANIRKPAGRIISGNLFCTFIYFSLRSRLALMRLSLVDWNPPVGGALRIPAIAPCGRQRVFYLHILAFALEDTVDACAESLTYE
jgi:hypothetical protein